MQQQLPSGAPEVLNAKESSISSSRDGTPSTKDVETATVDTTGVKVHFLFDSAELFFKNFFKTLF